MIYHPNIGSKRLTVYVIHNVTQRMKAIDVDQPCDEIVIAIANQLNCRIATDDEVSAHQSGSPFP